MKYAWMVVLLSAMVSTACTKKSEKAEETAPAVTQEEMQQEVAVPEEEMQNFEGMDVEEESDDEEMPTEE